MYSYREQVELLKPIKLGDGQSKRIDCPFCGGKSTMYVTRKDGKKLWHCFRASCSTSGSTKADRSLSGLRKALDASQEEVKRKGAPLPEIVSKPDHHEKVMAYLKDNHCLEAYREGLVRIRYAPAEQRVVFYHANGKGAVGRTLVGARPKWKAYGDTSELFSIGTGSTAVVVEDVASAASVSRFSKCSGCALLGTHLTSLHKQQLRAYEQIIVALDKDASRKAIKLKGRLEGLRPTTLVLLEKDLKYADAFELEELLS